MIYKIDIVIMGSKANDHREIYTETLSLDVRVGETSYKIDPDLLFETGGLPISRRGRLKGQYVIVFKEGDPTPIRPLTPEVSGRVLKIASESQALKKGLIDEFKEALDSRTLFMYLLLIIGGVLAYLVFTGGLHL